MRRSQDQDQVVVRVVTIIDIAPITIIDGSFRLRIQYRWPLLLYRLGQHRCMIPSRAAVSLSVVASVLETRGAIAAHDDDYLTPLPLTGATKDGFTAKWIEDAVSGERRAKLIPIRVGDDLLGVGSEFARQQTACIAEQPQTWKERLQVFRSDSLVKTRKRALERQLEKAEAAVRALTPPVGPGRVQLTTGWELERAVQAVLAEHEVADLLEAAWTREETSRTRSVGRGRGGRRGPRRRS